MTALHNIPFQQVSNDAQIALTEFDQRMLTAYTAKASTWAREHGLYIPSNLQRVRLPVPVFAAVFREMLGEQRWRTLSEKSIEIIPVRWSDGVEELASVIEAPDWVGWLQQPEAMAQAAAQVPARAVAAALEAGLTTTTPLAGAGQYFFGTGKPFLPGGSSSDYANNYPSCGAPDSTLIATIKNRFAAIKDPSGTVPLGVRWTHVFVPTALEWTFRVLLQQGQIVQSITPGTATTSGFGAVDNIHKGTVEIVVCPELTVDTVFYAACLDKPGMFPWAYADRGAPETVILDKSSDFYKLSGLKVRYGAIMTGAAALGVPQCIHRYNTAAD